MFPFLVGQWELWLLLEIMSFYHVWNSTSADDDPSKPEEIFPFYSFTIEYLDVYPVSPAPFFSIPKTFQGDSEVLVVIKMGNSPTLPTLLLFNTEVYPEVSVIF